jgi:hypothetical protein
VQQTWKLLNKEERTNPETTTEETMATLQNGKSPAQKIELGDKILCSVEAVDTTPIVNRVAAFQTAHQQYSAAEMAVRLASRALEEQRMIVAAADVNMNVAIEALAIALPNDGFPRRQPFAPFGGASPSLLQRMAFSDGAKAVIALEKAVLRHSGVSTKTAHIAHAAGDSARKLIEVMVPIEALEKAWTLTMAKREAFTPAWDRAFSKLKLAARVAETDGHEGIFAALFDRPTPPKKKPSGKRNAPAKPEEAPLSVQGPTSVPGS